MRCTSPEGYATNATPTVVINGNFITTQYSNINATGGGNYLAIANNGGATTTGSTTISGNTLTNITYKTTTSFGAVVYWVSGSGVTCSHNINVTGNTFSNITNTSIGTATQAANAYGILVSQGNINLIANNDISFISAAGGSVIGIFAANPSPNPAGGFSVNNNLLHDFTTSSIYSGSAAGSAQGMQVQAGPAFNNVFKNKIYNIRATASGTVNGMVIAQGTIGSTTNVYNNLIGQLNASTSIFLQSVRGINLASVVNNTTNVYYNTVYLDGNVPFNSYCVYQANATPTYNFRNNIFANNSNPTGVFEQMVYFRVSTLTSTYSISSNNNILWAGTPGPLHLIYADGAVNAITNPQQTLASFKTFVGPTRESNSQTEASPFLTISLGANAGFLHVDGTQTTLSESGAVNIGGFTEDFDNDIRAGNGGYAGTGTAPDIGADEFNTPASCSGTPATGTISASATAICAGSSAVLTGTGSGSTGVTYQWVSSLVSGGPYSPVAGATSLVVSTGVISAATYYKLVVTCTSSGLRDSTTQISVQMSPVVILTPLTATICTGGAVVLTASGGVSYSWAPAAGLSATTGASVSASPSVNTVYTVTVTAVGGCTGTKTSFVIVDSPLLIPTATPPIICLGDSAQLDAGNYSTSAFATVMNSNNGQSGNFFNVIASSKVTITSLSGNFNAGPNNVEIYYRLGGYGGFTTNIGAWTFAGVANALPANPVNTPTPIPVPLNLTILAGQTYGFLVICNNTANIAYIGAALAPAEGAVWAADANLQILAGLGTAIPPFGGAVFGGGAGSRCWNGVINYSMGDTNLTFSWVPSGTLNNGSIKNPKAGPATSSTYTVTVTNAGGCTKSATVSVGVTPVSPVAIAGSVTAPCGFGNATLNATGSGGILRWYAFSTGGAVLATGSPFILPVSHDTTFYVAEGSASSPFCEGVRTPVFVDVTEPVDIILTTSHTTICDSIPGSVVVNLSVSSTNPNYTYAWTSTSGGGLNTTTGTAVTANPTQAVYYTVTATDLTSNCVNIKTVLVGFSSTPDPGTVTATPAIICSGDVAPSQLNVTGTAVTYTWSPITGLSDPAIPNPTCVPPPGANIYTVTLSNFGCTASATVLVNGISTPPAPPVTGETVCGPDTVHLVSTPSNVTSNIYWTDTIGGQIIHTGSTFNPLVSQSGSYYVTEVAGIGSRNVGYNGIDPPVGFFPDVASFMNFTVLNSEGIIINTVDVSTNLGSGSWPLVIALTSSTGQVISIHDTIFIAGGSTALQTVSLNMFVPQGTWRLQPVFNPNLSVHQAATVTASLPWTIPGMINITCFGNVSSSCFATAPIGTFGLFYNWNISTGCNSLQSIVNYTVTVPPPVGISSGVSFCDTINTVLTAVDSVGGVYDVFNWSPATGLSATTGSSVTVSGVLASTVYTLTAFDNDGGCNAIATRTVSVNPSPSLTLGFTDTTVCENVLSIPFTAAAAKSSIVPLGNRFDPNFVDGGIYGGNADQYSQLIFTAAELNAAGLFGPTTISSIAFYVSSKLTTTTYMVDIQMKSDFTVPAFFPSIAHLNTGLTPVYNNPSIASVLGWNTYNFTTPFSWDGVSNVLVSQCFTHNVPGFFDIVPTSPVGFARYNSINANACGAATGALLNDRPNVRFTGGDVFYSWSPATGLSSTTIPNPVLNTSLLTKNVPHTYSLTVTDPLSGCAKTKSLTVRINSYPQPYIFPDDTILCTGQVLTIVARDSGAFSGGWPGGTSFDFGFGPTADSTFVINGPGVFNVNVTLSSTLAGCATLSPTADITYRDAPVLVLNTDSVKCFGGNTGYISAEVFLGSTPFRFRYYNSLGNLVRDTVTSSSTDTLFSASAGQYCVVVYDTATGSYPPPSCSSDSICIIVPEPLLLVANESHLPIACNGNSTNVTISATGGTPPYSGTGIFSQSAGSQIYTVTDAHGCTAQINVNLTQPEVLVVSLPMTYTPCVYTSGGLSASLSGGTPPYSYSWSNGSTSASVGSLIAGTYTVTVTDVNGCSATSSASVNPPGLLILTSTPVNPVCRGAATGSISLGVSGGVPGYTYLWNGGTTTQNRTGVGAGTYTVTVTDINGCTKTKTTVVTQPATNLLINTSQTNIRCFGLNSGVASVSPTGGTGPYSYSWNTIPVKTTSSISTLVSGVYTCSVTDAIGCTKTAVITITEPTDISVFQTQSNVTFPGGNNGSATVSVSGGTAPYTYLWNTVPVKTTATITGLTAGTYKCTITDSKNCQKKVTFIITEPIAKPGGPAGEEWLIRAEPNPSSGMVRITLDNASEEQVNVTLTDVTGRQLYVENKKTNSGTNEFHYDFTSFSKGVYFIKLSDSNRSKVIRLVIQ